MVCTANVTSCSPRCASGASFIAPRSCSLRAPRNFWHRISKHSQTSAIQSTQGQQAPVSSVIRTIDAQKTIVESIRLQEHEGSNTVPFVSLIGVLAVLATCVASADAASLPLAEVADIDAPTAKLLESVLRPLFSVYTLLYIVRIPMTWYPDIEKDKLPWALAVWPTEPFLNAMRKVVSLVGGVDVTPIVWVALISFFNEIMLGPQGLLTLIQRQV